MTGADIQIDNGDYARVHNAILDALASARLTGSEFRCVLFLLRKTYGWNKKEDRISLSQWATGTNMIRSNIVGILRELERKSIIYRRIDEGQVPVFGFNKYVEEWQEIGVSAEIPQRFKKHELLSCSTTVILQNTSDATVILQDTRSGMLQDTRSGILQDTHKRHLKTIKDNLPDASKKTPRKPRKADKTPGELAQAQTHKEIMAVYRELVGYPINEPRENKGAQVLAKNGYSAGQVADCYAALKSEDFWESKHLSLQTIASQIGALIGAPEPSNGNGSLVRPLTLDVFEVLK
jgi:phage replication O-like protein O